MSRRIRVSDGLSAKYWLTSAGYVAIGLLLLLFVLVGVLESSGNTSVAQALGYTYALFLIAYTLGGALTYPAIFKDAAFLRSDHSRWRPKWWYYIGAAVGIPLTIGILSSALSVAAIGWTVAIMIHAVTAWVANAAYLYRRHEHVGVP